MNQLLPRRLFISGLIVLSVSCGFVPVGQHITRSGGVEQQVAVSFNDETEELVGHAERLIEKNEREGAVLDQRWYTLKRFGPYQDVIFAAEQILFYGGLENDVRRELRGRYASITPIEDDPDAGDIRLFLAERERGPPDVVIIGQNGREVALKTVIRLINLARLAGDERQRNNRKKFQSFRQSLRVFRSSTTPAQEFTRFFRRSGISRLDVVVIGFRADVRALLHAAGVADPESYADESLRVNWYPNANGKKILLVSIDENRIYGSRSGSLIEAVLEMSGEQAPAIVFLGSGGAIDEPAIVGTVVLPAVVLNGNPFPADGDGAVAHIVPNRAGDHASVRTAHASVENVIVETTEWAARMKTQRIRTADQELFHIVKAINGSARGRDVPVFAAILVTDNISSDRETNRHLTLEHAEAIIAKSSAARREFFNRVLNMLGVPGARERRSDDATRAVQPRLGSTG